MARRRLQRSGDLTSNNAGRWATRLDEQGASVADRMASLGHAEAEMTMHYTRSDIERRREVLEKIAEGMVQ